MWFCESVSPQHTQFAFGHGCDHSSYVNAKHNFIQVIGNGNLTHQIDALY